MSETTRPLAAALLPKEKLIAAAAMTGSAACWGLSTVMSRDLLNTMTPMSLLVVQLTASVAVLLLMAGPRFPHRYKGIGRAALIGIFEPGLTFSVGLAGLALTTAGKASLIAASETGPYCARGLGSVQRQAVGDIAGMHQPRHRRCFDGFGRQLL